MAVRIDSPNPYVGVTWGSAIKTTLLIIAAVSVFGIIGMIGVGSFYEQTENASINYYCNEAQLPSLKSSIRNREIVDIWAIPITWLSRQTSTRPYRR